MAEIQLGLDIFPGKRSAGKTEPVRREAREEIVRVVEYAPFPRQTPNQIPHLGFSRDISRSGMCLGTDFPEVVGSLLHITVRAGDGQPTRDSVERVVWCESERDGRFWLGLELLTKAEPPSCEGQLALTSGPSD